MVRNAAIGGIPSFPFGLCLKNELGSNADVVSWDFSMNEPGLRPEGNGGKLPRLKPPGARNYDIAAIKRLSERYSSRKHAACDYSQRLPPASHPQLSSRIASTDVQGWKPI